MIVLAQPGTRSTATVADATAATGTAPLAAAATYVVRLGEGVPADLLLRDNARSLRTESGAGAAVIVTHAPPGEGFVARYWLPVTDLFNDATSIAADDLARALHGEITDWKALGASAAPIHLFLPAEQLPELRLLLGGALPTGVDTGVVVQGTPAEAATPPPARISVLPARDLPAAVELERGALGLMPLEAVDFHVRALPVDGVDLLRGVGDAGAYPLATRIAVAPAPGRPGDDAVRSVQAMLSAPLPAPERLLATGDIIPARCVYDRQRRYGDYRHAFLEVAPTLRTADLAIGSLDATISDQGTPIGCRETFSLLAPAESIQGITFAGIGLLTIAANHAKDCGESACGDRAFLDTIARLDAAGVAHAGGGRTLAEARSPAAVTVKGVRFAFLGYDDIAAQYYGAGERSPGTAPLDLKTLAADVRAAKGRADVVVVMVHWGVEYTPDPTDRQREAARIAVEAGATLVVGNHPHVVQAVEAFPGGFADYALGNFVFDQDWSEETLEGVVMEAVFDGPRLRQVTFLPLRIQDMHQPHFLTRERGRPILDRMQKASARVAGR